MQDPGKVKGSPGIVFAAAAAQLQLRLLETYLALPDASAFTMEHAAVSKLCARALRFASGQAGTGSLLRNLYNLLRLPVIKYYWF